MGRYFIAHDGPHAGALVLTNPVKSSGAVLVCVSTSCTPAAAAEVVMVLLLEVLSALALGDDCMQSCGSAIAK